MTNIENPATQLPSVEVGTDINAPMRAVPFNHGSEGSLTINALDLWEAIQATPGLMSQKIIRVSGGWPHVNSDPGVVQATYTFADNRVAVSPRTGILLVDEEPRHATKIPLAILTLLAQNCDLIMTRPMIHDNIWGIDRVRTSNNIDATISLVRKLLGQELGDPKQGAIRTARGLGWRAVSTLSC